MAARRRSTPQPEPAVDPLLAQVLAEPDDDALRQVWADALQERGDPRGELIAIQIAATGGVLTKAQDVRVRSILAKHVREWLGPLDEVIMRRAGLSFDRGVISSCQLQIQNLDALASAVGHPLWATVRRMWFCDRYAWDARIAPLLLHPVLRSLREITCIGMHNVFGVLATHERPLPVSSIWTMDDSWRAEDASRLIGGPAGEAASLPALRRLGFTSTNARSAWVFRLPVVRRIEELGLTVGESAGECLRRASELPKLRVLELRPDFLPSHGMYRSHFVLTFERDDRGNFGKLSVELGGFVGPFTPRLEGVRSRDLGPDRAPDIRRLAALLRGLAPQLQSVPKDVVERIDVHMPDEPELRSAFEHFDRAKIRFVGLRPNGYVEQR